jgi:hypothetical protein
MSAGAWRMQAAAPADPDVTKSRAAGTPPCTVRSVAMKLYVDLKGERHYLVTEDGEAVYVDDLQEDGRDTEYLDQAIDAAWRRPTASRSDPHARRKHESLLDVEVFDSD